MNNDTMTPKNDVAAKITDICRTAKNTNVRKILLGELADLSDDDFYETKLAWFCKRLRQDPRKRLDTIKRIVNVAFAYIISKYTSIAADMDVTSNCEARINNVIGNLYNAYNATDDVVQYVILNVALGLDASDMFKEKFEFIAQHSEFYKNTNEYINIFNHIQYMRNAAFKASSLDSSTLDWLYKLLSKVGFICDLEIIPLEGSVGSDALPSEEFADAESNIVPCAFKLYGKTYSSKYAFAVDRTDGYDRFVLLRSIDEVTERNGQKRLRLNYTDVGSYDTGENIAVTVVADDCRAEGRVVLTKSIGTFYSFITGDLLRKRHRMSFCNGLSSYKYYGELVASVIDAFEKIEILPNKRQAVIEKYILPVIKNNFNICKEECICLGTGCKRATETRPCNKDRFIDLEKDLAADCVGNMDVVSILTILFSVVGCKEILPQIFDRYEFDAQALDVLFDTVNSQLEKRFSEFTAERVNSLRDEFYKKSIDYLSLNIDESRFNDPTVALPLKPFRIRAYTDALIAVLENLNRDGTDGAINPIGNVYSISNKIELISGIKNIKDVRATLRDTLKVILAYYAGLSACGEQQLTYEVRAEQASKLGRTEIAECENAIKEAFRSGVVAKLAELGDDPSFYKLFETLKNDNKTLKDKISIMLGREMINASLLEKFIRTDKSAGKCYIHTVVGGETYECNLDDEAQCGLAEYKNVFVNRVVELLRFFNGEGSGGTRGACYPQVLTHTSSRVNVDNTTISAFTSCESDSGNSKKEYNVITYFKYEIGKRYFYVAPKKYEKTRWITYPILVRCSEFYGMVFGGK